MEFAPHAEQHWRAHSYDVVTLIEEAIADGPSLKNNYDEHISGSPRYS